MLFIDNKDSVFCILVETKHLTEPCQKLCALVAWTSITLPGYRAGLGGAVTSLQAESKALLPDAFSSCFSYRSRLSRSKPQVYMRSREAI